MASLKGRGPFGGWEADWRVLGGAPQSSRSRRANFDDNRAPTEIPLYGARSDTILVSARADAITFEANAPIAAFDWKSDVAPTPDIHAGYMSQLLEYLKLIAAEKGAIVYMTSGEFHWVHRRSSAPDDLVP